MPCHTIECTRCGNRDEMFYKISEDPAKKAADTKCFACCAPNKIDYSALRTGAPVVTFQAGFYNVGTNGAKPKYYNSQREMNTDADRHGLRIRRG